LVIEIELETALKWLEKEVISLEPLSTLWSIEEIELSGVVISALIELRALRLSREAITRILDSLSGSVLNRSGSESNISAILKVSNYT
jgi:hypothetical protein